jgi:hypothetical protein
MKQFLLLLALAGAWPPAQALAIGNASPEEQSATQQQTVLTQETIDKLLTVISALDARVKELEKKLEPDNKTDAVKKPEEPVRISTPVVTAAAPAPQPSEVPKQESTDHDHSVRLPGGPVLNIRGFADINLGFGQDANPLIFPLGAPAHTSFEIGEIDFYMTSQLSRKISFLGEFVIGSDATNTFGWDVERFQVTYKQNNYFQISGGRFHTSIGYYNTAFHHGTWFQTATGRPFMYFFEDSGGILPVHTVGATATGLIPKTGKLNLHWVAEGGNGRSSDPATDPVQSFLADRNRKAFNAAVYARPDWVPGLQVGGSFYVDKLYPPRAPGVTQNISSAYAVYSNSAWEFLNEAVMLTNKQATTGLVYHSPLMYTQLSRAFGLYRPYFRYQYVNVPANDPVNIFTGRYMGPSVGLRMDFTTYLALKVQYNRLYQRMLPAWNGLDLQMAFTF